MLSRWKDSRCRQEYRQKCQPDHRQETVPGQTRRINIVGLGTASRKKGTESEWVCGRGGRERALLTRARWRRGTHRCHRSLS